MPRPTLAELELRCQKPDHRRVGNWLARRVARPLALYITWLIVPFGISAHAVTLAALCVAGLAAIAFAQGSLGMWIAGAALLQVWYLLDHVDGQIARYHGAASLDGAALDYLMHHLVPLLVALGLGFGLFRGSGNEAWLVCGAIHGVCGLAANLVHDVRYKAFFQRLKRLEGTRLVAGGSGGRPAPPMPCPRRFFPALAWCLRKSHEVHIVLVVTAGIAIASAIGGDQALALPRIYLASMTVGSILLAALVWTRSLRQSAAEREYSAWFQLPPESRGDLDGIREDAANRAANAEPRSKSKAA